MSNMIQNAVEMPVVFYKFTVRGKASKTNVKEMSREAEEAAKADKGTVTSLVTRIPSCFAKPVKTVEGQIRNLFYKEAIVLGDSYGVPIAILPSFKSKLDKLVQEYHLHYSKLLDAAHSGELITILAKQSGELIERIKAPTVTEIEEGYGVEIDMDVNFTSSAVETAMKVLSDDLKDQLRKEVEVSRDRQNKAQLESVGQTIVGTVKELLLDIQDRCARQDVKGTHFQSLIDKVEHIVKVLPAYNVTNNPEMDKLLSEVKAKFENLDKDTLKVSADERQKAVDAAAEITKGFADLF